jgi:transcriptional regulator with XRE-family HTH domain
MGANDPDIGEDGLRELRDIRLRRGLSQADLSAKTGVAEFTISQIEAGKRANPRPSTLRKLAQALDVEVADLYGSPEHPLAEAPPSPEQPPLNGFEEERRISIDYAACREALDGFCAHWEPVLSGERLLDRQGFNDFDAAAKGYSRLFQELIGAEKAELGPLYEDGEPVFYSERSVLWPAIDRFMVLAIQMDKLGKEQLGEDVAATAGVADFLEFARKRAS